MMHRASIVVGIDFSPGAAAAAAWAHTMAQMLRAELVAVHVTAGDGWAWRPEGCGWMGELGLDPEALVVRPGIPWIELSRHADELGALMIVTGSHGSSGYQPIALGATSMMLLARSRRPVLVVPAP